MIFAGWVDGQIGNLMAGYMGGWMRELFMGGQNG